MQKQTNNKQITKTTIYAVEFEMEDESTGKEYSTYEDNFPEDFDDQIFCQNKPLPDDWKWPRFKKTRGVKLVTPDFPYIFGYDCLLLMKENVWKIVEKTLTASGQCYSLSIGMFRHYICFPWRVFSLDVEKDPQTGDFRHIFEPKVFDGQYPLFQTDSDNVLYTISSPNLRKAGLDFEYIVRENGLTGLTFEKVWESEE